MCILYVFGLYCSNKIAKGDLFAFSEFNAAYLSVLFLLNANDFLTSCIVGVHLPTIMSKPLNMFPCPVRQICGTKSGLVGVALVGDNF